MASERPRKRILGVPMRIHVGRRELIITVLPALALIVGGFWLAYQFVRPAPPSKVVMSTGAEDGAYHAFAKKYRAVLAEEGITLELRTSSGSVENLARLKDANSGVDVALVQGGIAGTGDASGLISLGQMFHEPLWVFYRGGDTVERLSELKGKRIAIGPEGSGTRRLALSLLGASGINARDATLLDLAGDKAADALVHGRLDVLLMVSAPEAQLVRKLAHTGGVQLMHLAQADAYVRRFPYLSRLTLPAGVIDLARNLPPAPIALVSPTANLVAREDLHPAIITLLARAAQETHGGASAFGAAGEFPATRESEFPIADGARRYYRQGPPFLQRYLPFWLAVLAERTIVLLVPLLTIVLPVMRFGPPVYRWRVHRRIISWYGKLRLLELELRRKLDTAALEEIVDALDHIEDEVNAIHVPLAFAEEVYNLRAHIGLVRSQLRDRYAARTKAPGQEKQPAGDSA